MRKSVLIGIIVIMLLSGGYFLYNKDKAVPSNNQPVNTVRVERRNLSETVEATGTVVAAKSMEIFFDYKANVKRITVNAGDRVREGDLLMVLDSAEFNKEWINSDSSLKQAELNLELAKKELARLKELYLIQGASAEAIETAQNKVDLYTEQAKVAKIKFQQLLPEYISVASDHREIRVHAPFSGKIAWINVRTGNEVTAQTLVKEQTLLLTIYDDQFLEVEAEVDETDINLVQHGQPAVIISNDPNNSEYQGKVTELGNIGAEKSGVILFPVRVRVSNKNEQLKPGMSVDITITVRQAEGALTIPLSAVVNRKGRSVVAVEKGKEVEYRRVQTGIKSDNYVEIRSGLREGEPVLVQRPKTINQSGSARPNSQGQRMMMPRIRR